MSHYSFDVIGTVIDEIALEGLEGVTLPSLWVRLSQVQFSLDVKQESVQEFIWKTVVLEECCKSTFQLFLLPQNRAPLVLYNRYEQINPETGCCLEDASKIPDDIYGVINPVKDANDIKGSCAFFNSRVDVTKRILDEQLSLKEALKKFDENNLVIVANQSERNKSLMGTCVDPCLQLMPMHYCILERVGRFRYLGEITIGKESAVYKESPKTLFYFRKKLIKKNLIKKKQHIAFNVKTYQNSHGLVLSLPRFFVERLTPIEQHARRICIVLVEAPNCESTFSDLRESLSLRAKMLKNIVLNYSSNFEFEDRLSDQSEKEVVRYIKMIKPFSDDAEEAEDIDDDDDEDEEERCRNNKYYKIQYMFNPAKIQVDRPLLSQALHIIQNCPSEEGISQKELGEALSIPKLETRSLVRYLEKLGDISTIMVDRGKQKVSMYLAKNRSDAARSLLEKERKSLTPKSNETVIQLRRMNILLEYVKEMKVVDRIFTLKKLIREEEADMCYKVDTKSVLRIVHKLASEGLLKSIRTVLKFGETTRKLHFVCVPEIATDDPIVREKIEQWKFRLFVKTGVEITLERNRRKQVLQLKQEFNNSDINQNASNDVGIVQNETSENEPIRLIYQPSAARRYGCEPKMKKLLTLYRFLFYLTYEDASAQPMYTDWRRHILPLAEVPGHCCTIGAIVPRMPLSIFVKIVWIAYIIPGIDEYLNDPVKIHLPLSQLSPRIRQSLLYRRKFAFNICASLASLSYLGLVETKHKEQFPKETLVIYVKNKTSLKTDDKVVNYEFQTLADFEKYAADLQFHCLNPCSECSLDPKLFPHNNRNWTYTPGSKQILSRTRQRLTNLQLCSNPEDETSDSDRTSKRKNEENMTSSPKRQKLSPKSPRNKKGTSPVRANSDNRQKPGRRVLASKKVVNKNRRVFDAVDQRAKCLLKKQRADWTSEEDTFLLVCKITSSLLDPQSPHYICVNRNIVRDELHMFFPKISYDKTALACQRRINYMLKSPQTRQNVTDWVGQLSQEINIVRPNVPKTHEKEWETAFLNLHKVVLRRMQTSKDSELSLSARNLNFSSREELLSDYEICRSVPSILPQRLLVYQNARNIVDIHVNVVTNVLLSTLLSKSYIEHDKQENYYFAHDLFKIYQRYPDTLIRSVVAKLSKHGIMTKIKKVADAGTLKSRGMTPFRISRHYLFLLQTKYTMETLARHVNTDDIELFDGKHGSDAALVACLFTTNNVQFKIDIPDNFVTLDDKCPLPSTLRGGNNSFAKNDSKCSSRYALYVLRQEVNMKSSDRNQHAQDYLVINQCTVKAKAKRSCAFPTKKFDNVLNEQQRFIEAQTPSLRTKHAKLVDFIKSKKEIGATQSEMEKFNKNVWPGEALAELTRKHVVYRVGIREFQWVHANFIHPWLIESTNSEKDLTVLGNDNASVDKTPRVVKFIARCWKKPNGVIDARVLFKFLSGVFSHIKSYPGIPQEKLTEHFSFCVQPVQLMEIVDILEAAECIERQKFEPIDKPLLFGRSSKVGMQVYFEATANGFVNLCNIKSILKV